MYKGKGKGLKQVIDVADYYLCAIYDFLWGEKISRLAQRAYAEKRSLNWHEKTACILGDYLPLRLMILPDVFRIMITSRRVRRLKENIN